MTGSPSSSPSESPVTQTPSLHPTSKPVTQTPSASPSKSPVTETPSLQPSGSPITEVSDQINTDVSIEVDNTSDTDSVSTIDVDTALDIDSSKEVEVEEVKDESGERDAQDTEKPSPSPILSNSPTLKDKCRRLKEKKEKDKKKKEDSSKKQDMKKEQPEVVTEEEEVKDEECVETETSSSQDAESPIESETSNTSVEDKEIASSSPFDNGLESSSPEEQGVEALYPLPISPFTLTIQTDNTIQSNTIDENELELLVTNHLLKEMQLERSSADVKMVSINVRPFPAISGLTFGGELPNDHDYKVTGNIYFEDLDMPTSEVLGNVVVQSFEKESAERLLKSLQSAEDDGLQSVKSISIDMSDQINIDMVSNRLDVNDEPIVNDQLYIIAIIFGVACFTLIAIYAFNRTRRRHGDEHEVLEDEVSALSRES